MNNGVFNGWMYFKHQIYIRLSQAMDMALAVFLRPFGPGAVRCFFFSTHRQGCHYDQCRCRLPAWTLVFRASNLGSLHSFPAVSTLVVVIRGLHHRGEGKP
jgi:hypothetical protein